MESIIKNGQEEQKYPCLKIGESGRVILFTDKSKGVLVHDPVSNEIGKTSEIWAEFNFKPFNGEITLKN